MNGLRSNTGAPFRVIKVQWSIRVLIFTDICSFFNKAQMLNQFCAIAAAHRGAYVGVKSLWEKREKTVLKVVIQ